MTGKLFFENPPSKDKIKDAEISIIFIVCIGIVFFAWTGLWPAIALLFVIGGLNFLVFYWGQYVMRPRFVRIVGGGLELEFRHGRSIFVAWKDIMALNAPNQDLSKKKGRNNMDGILFLRGRGLPLRADIAIAVKDAYQEQSGKVLPNYLNEKAKDERKSI